VAKASLALRRKEKRGRQKSRFSFKVITDLGKRTRNINQFLLEKT